MPTKEEIEKQLNEKLGTEFEWSKMRADELKDLDAMVDNGEFLERQMKHIVARHGKGELERRIKEWSPGQVLARLM